MKNLKFLKIGVAATLIGAGLISNQVQASDDTNFINSESTFSQSLNQLVKEQYNKGLISENYSLNVIKAEDKKIVIDGLEFIKFANLDLNIAEIARNMCKVTVSFDKDGNTGKLAGKHEELDATNLQNETQKEMMREFITLHEIFHCELAKIEKPIIVDGVSKEVNDKFNYYIKDIQSITDKDEKISYFGVLSETYGDIGATGLLLKKYGKDNSDLNFVMKSIQTQRHAGYFLVNSNNHFTHMGMESTLDENIRTKLINTVNGDEYKNEILKLSNQSVQQLITQRKDLAETMFSQEKLESSIKFHITHDILNRSENLNLSPQIMQEFRFQNNEKGFIRQLSNKFLQDEDISYFTNKKADFLTNQDKADKVANKLINYSAELYSDKKNDIFNSITLKEYKQTINNFKETIFNQNNDKITQFDIKDEKTKAVDKMLALRNKFLESNNKNNNKIKIN